MLKGEVGRIDLPGGNHEEMKTSLNLLRQLPPEWLVFPGHGEITTIKKELQTNQAFGEFTG